MPLPSIRPQSSLSAASDFSSRPSSASESSPNISAISAAGKDVGKPPLPKGKEEKRAARGSINPPAKGPANTSTPATPQSGSRPSTTASASNAKPSSNGRPPSGQRKGHAPIDEAALAYIQKREAIRVKLREDQHEAAIESAERNFQNEARKILNQISERDVYLSEKETFIAKLQVELQDRQRDIQALQDQKQDAANRLAEAEAAADEQRREVVRLLSAKGGELQKIADLQNALRDKGVELERMTTLYKAAAMRRCNPEPTPTTLPEAEITAHIETVKTIVKSWTERIAFVCDSLIEATVRYQQEDSIPLDPGPIVEQAASALLEMRGMWQYLYTVETSRNTDTLIAFENVRQFGFNMHSNIPTHVKKRLHDMTKEQLIVLLDCLSFEEGVCEYLQADLYPRYFLLPPDVTARVHRSFPDDSRLEAENTDASLQAGSEDPSAIGLSEVALTEDKADTSVLVDAASLNYRVGIEREVHKVIPRMLFRAPEGVEYGLRKDLYNVLRGGLEDTQENEVKLRGLVVAEEDSEFSRLTSLELSGRSRILDNTVSLKAHTALLEAASCIDQHKPNEAARVLDSVIQEGEQDPLLLYERAGLCSASGDYERAFTLLSRCLAIRKSYVDAYLRRCSVALTLKKPEIALADVSVVIEIQKRQNSGKFEGRLLVQRAQCLHLAERHLEAWVDVLEASEAEDIAYFRDELSKVKATIWPFVQEVQRADATQRLKGIVETSPPVEFAEAGSAELSNPEACGLLDRVLALVQEYNGIKLRILGCSGSKKGLKVADERSQTCLKYMLGKGADPAIVFNAALMGESRPPIRFEVEKL